MLDVIYEKCYINLIQKVLAFYKEFYIKRIITWYDEYMQIIFLFFDSPSLLA